MAESPAVPMHPATGRLASSIPKIIHQTFPLAELPEELARNVERIRELNPDWEYRFYTDADVVQYLQVNCPWALNYYHRISGRYGAARADLFRYLVVYLDGGIYLDIKSSVSRPLSQVIDQDDRCLLSHWRNRAGEKYEGWGIHQEIGLPAGEFQQWFIASVPHHRFLQRVIKEVCSNIDSYHPVEFGVGRQGTWRLTGPIAYTKAIMQVMAQGEYRLVDAEEDLGLHYSIFFNGRDSHHKHLFKKHYAKQRGLLVRQGMVDSLVMGLKYRLNRLGCRLRPLLPWLSRWLPLRGG